MIAGRLRRPRHHHVTQISPSSRAPDTGTPESLGCERRLANHIQGRRDGFTPRPAMPAWRVGLTRQWPGGPTAADLGTVKLVRYLEFVQAAPPRAVATAEPR